jgi:hypothetical protein
MATHSHAAHWIGVAGELLNFAGALVLAADLFLRRNEHSEAKRLEPLGEWGRKHGLSAKYKTVPVSAADFAEKVQGHRTGLLGFWGVLFIALGFLSLVGYHLVAIYMGD